MKIFGHKKGSFTGANSDKVGLFEKADGGTLFLDEIGTIPLSIQKSFSGQLNQRLFSRIGSTDVIQVNFNLITASCDDIEKLIKQNKFRLDFFFRINGHNLHISSLRERNSDIPLLIKHFTSKKTKRIFIQDEAMKLLMEYKVAGNIRELKHNIEILLSRSSGSIAPEDLPKEIQFNSNSSGDASYLTNDLLNNVRKRGLAGVIKEIEDFVFANAHEENNGKINAIASDISISKSVLYRLQKSFNERRFYEQ